EGARRFGDDFAEVTQIVEGMGKTETYDARRTALRAPMTSDQATARTQAPRPDRSRIGMVSRPPVSSSVTVQKTVSTTLLQTPNERGNAFVAWVSGGGLLLVVCISAFTALSNLRPVRRRRDAARRTANGEAAG